MNSFQQYIQQALPHLHIDSFQQNESGWDNIAIIINNALLFRFPRKVTAAKRIPLEKELCSLLAKSLHDIEIPNYHLLYSNESDAVPACSYYTFIHGKPLTPQMIANLTIQEREKVMMQIARFLATLHTISMEHAIQLGFKMEKTITYWKQLQIKLNGYLSHLLTRFEKEAFDKFFHQFFTLLHRYDLQHTMIHADFTHHHILFDEKHKKVSGIIDFGDTQIGDPAFDFAGLYHDFGSIFTEDVYKKYCALIPHHDSSFMKRIISFYQHSPLLHQLLYNLERKDEHAIHNGLKNLRTMLQGLN
ncbi:MULTISPECIES: aminoglycoside phosphotransferase family protein [unclassified Bacillus cereus group]|uniref:aminoglycoside phosphotransferase family protein n=1 Tax=unclassified Bacillus cereus group TaxID=2750818 RepID=UPI001F585F05|nr:MULTISPECIES: aminoglycoside phosphotransferase family protein [unclassified Bacillus cereus group]